MEIILVCVLNGLLVVWASYKSKQYLELLAKYEIVVEELCEYLDDEAQEESEWGNRR